MAQGDDGPEHEDGRQHRVDHLHFLLADCATAHNSHNPTGEEDNRLLLPGGFRRGARSMHLPINSFRQSRWSGNPSGAALRQRDAENRQRDEPVETTFVFPPTDTKVDLRVRYFTPQNEVAVADHPTIANHADPGYPQVLAHPDFACGTGGSARNRCGECGCTLPHTENVSGIYWFVARLTNVKAP